MGTQRHRPIARAARPAGAPGPRARRTGYGAGCPAAAACALALLAAFGCGGAPAVANPPPEPVTVEPRAFLRELAAQRAEVMRAPSRPLEELEAARREARGRARRERTRDVVGAHLAAWEAAQERRERRRHRRLATRLADAALRGSRDRAFDAQLDFAKLWMSYLADERGAPRRAERFTTRYAQHGGGLLGLAWMIRGELALAEGDHDAAMAAFRFALGQLGTPLYAYALYRTAVTHRARGETQEAAQALDEVARMGCDAEAPALTRRLAAAAASEAGAGLRRDPHGVIRPASCPAPGEREPEEEGWRPAE